MKINILNFPNLLEQAGWSHEKGYHGYLFTKNNFDLHWTLDMPTNLITLYDENITDVEAILNIPVNNFDIFLAAFEGIFGSLVQPEDNILRLVA